MTLAVALPHYQLNPSVSSTLFHILSASSIILLVLGRHRQVPLMPGLPTIRTDCVDVGAATDRVKS